MPYIDQYHTFHCHHKHLIQNNTLKTLTTPTIAGLTTYSFNCLGCWSSSPPTSRSPFSLTLPVNLNKARHPCHTMQTWEGLMMRHDIEGLMPWVVISSTPAMTIDYNSNTLALIVSRFQASSVCNIEKLRGCLTDNRQS